MNRKFSQSSRDFPTIKRKDMIFSILVGIFNSFAFYLFLCLTREVVRLYSITDKYDMWILSNQEVNFYNLFFAYLSLIFAQSICLSKWFGRPRKLFEKVNLPKKATINDQLFLNTVFLHWFSKLGLVYALFLGIVTPGFYVFSFYPKYNYLFILILTALFLQTWNTIRRTCGRKTFKWMLYSAVLISVLAFAYSRVNLIDYQKINQIFLEKNSAHKYNLELAEVDKFEYFPHRFIGDIYLVNPSDTAESKNPLIIFDGKELSFDKLEQKLLIYTDSMKKHYSFEYHVFASFRLYVDKSIKMSFVNRLKKAIANAGIYKIAYAVIPKKREYDKRYYTDCSSVWSLIEKEYKNADLKEFELLSVCYSNNNLQINDRVYHPNDFYSEIKQLIEKHDNYLVVFAVDDEMFFNDYMFILSEIKRAVAAIRNECAIKTYAIEYEMLNLEKAEIQQKIPLRLMEINSTKQ